MIRGYINTAVALLFIGVVVAIGVMIIDSVRKRRSHALYKQFLVIVAIVGATIGALVDSVVGPYLVLLRERLLNINLYTPVIFSIVGVLIMKKVIEHVDR